MNMSNNFWIVDESHAINIFASPLTFCPHKMSNYLPCNLYKKETASVDALNVQYILSGWVAIHHVSPNHLFPRKIWRCIYSISQEICTRFCCALLCCGYAIVHNDSHEVFIHIHQGCFAGTGAIVRLPQCQWSKPDGYGKISQCITTTKHSKAKTVCTFLGIYCTQHVL